MVRSWSWSKEGRGHGIRHVGKSAEYPGWSVIVERGAAAEGDDLMTFQLRGRTPNGCCCRRIPTPRSAEKGSVEGMYNRLKRRAEAMAEGNLTAWEARHQERSRLFAIRTPATDPQPPDSTPPEPEPIPEPEPRAVAQGCTRVEVPELGIDTTAETEDASRAAHDVVSEFLWDEPGRLSPEARTVEARTSTTAAAGIASDLVSVAVSRARRWFTDKLTGETKR